MKKKLILLLLAIAGMMQYAIAANGLWLEKRDGGRIGFLFEQQIGIIYKTDSIFIYTEDAVASYPFDDVERICFDENVTNIDLAIVNSCEQQVRVTASGVEIKGFAAGTLVVVSNLAGSNFMSRTTDANGLLFIRKSDLPHGVNIIKAGKNSIKFNNK